MKIIDVNSDIQSQKNNAQRSFVRTIPEQDENPVSDGKQEEQETQKKTRKTKRVQTEKVWANQTGVHAGPWGASGI